MLQKRPLFDNWSIRPPRLVMLLLCALLLAAPAFAEQYPAKPIRIIVPYAAGGLSDVLARTVGAKLSQGLGQPVVVDNRPGASAIIGCELVAKSAPDGYTLLMISSGNLITNPTLFEHLPYDTSRDFAPISNVAFASYLLDVHPSLPVTSVKELIALAKARPGEINAAIPGTGTGGHLALELFMSMSGTRFTQVPYKGAGPALSDTLGGQTMVIMDTLPTSLQSVRRGALRALGQSSAERSPLLPDVPTLSEAGVPGYESVVYNALLAPAGTPREIINRIQAELAKIAGTAEAREEFQRLGLTMTATTPDALAAFIRTETARWEKIIRETGIKPE